MSSGAELRTKNHTMKLYGSGAVLFLRAGDIQYITGDQEAAAVVSSHGGLQLVDLRPSTMNKTGRLTTSADMSSDETDRNPHVSGEQLFQLRQISGKGHGLVASQSIKRGACIIEESPVIRLQPTTSEQQSQIALACQVSALSSEEAKVIDELYHDPRKLNFHLLQESIFNTKPVSMGDAGQYALVCFRCSVD